MLNTIFVMRLMSVVTKMELREVIARLHKFAPPWLSESWDNVGLLVEPSSPHVVDRLMLTNDLTESVAEEAIHTNVQMILSYHPPVFKPLKRLTQQSWKERIVVKCIENRIAVFSPHTCYDALQAGVNDWLIAPFGGRVKPIVTATDKNIVTAGDLSVSVVLTPELVEPFIQKLEEISQLSLKHRLVTQDQQVKLTFISSEKSLVDVMTTIQQFDGVLPTVEVTKLAEPPMPGYGPGRLSVLSSALSLRHCVDMMKSHLHLSHLRLARAVGQHIDGEVKTVAVCAGSGASLLSDVQADLFVTGEMSHHDVLNAVHSGTSVILCEHSNTERGFLAVLQQQLHSLFEGRIEVSLSCHDRDPIEIV